MIQPRHWGRPSWHEDWCEYTWSVEYYCPCTCDLEERQARWDAENRQPNASPLPRAIVVRR